MEKSKILSYITKPYESYVDINAVNLKNLFERIKREESIGSEEFETTVQPVIVSEIERYCKDENGDDAVFWGAWFKAADCGSPHHHMSLTFKQKNLLALLMQREDAAGELIGYGLCVFAGMTISEVMNARYRDVQELKGYPKIKTIYTRGAFPKFGKATEYDLLPRKIPLPDAVADLIEKRLERIEKDLDFPLKTEQEIFSSAKDLPIACNGLDYSRFCRMSDLSVYARDVLRCGFCYDEKAMSYTSAALVEEPGLFAYERSAAYHLGRRDFTGALYTSGVRDAARCYILGIRNDFDEEGSSSGRIIDISSEELASAKMLYEDACKVYFEGGHINA